MFAAYGDCVTHHTRHAVGCRSAFRAAVHLGGLVHEMVKGANVGLSALSENVGAVVVGLGWSSATGEGDADVSVLLLHADGKVRSDADFCFYNNPVAGDGSVHLLGKTPTADGSEDRISFDLDAVPPEVDKVVVAASRYGGARFGDLDGLRLTLADSTGDALARFAVHDVEEVSALIFGELYRRAGEWKFRAVGQGYASGLAGLATDYGVDIDDDAETADGETAVAQAARAEAADEDGASRSGRVRNGRARGGSAPSRRGPPRRGPVRTWRFRVGGRRRRPRAYPPRAGTGTPWTGRRRVRSPPSPVRPPPPPTRRSPRAAPVRRRRRSPCPVRPRSPSPTTTPGAPPGCSPAPPSRATGSARRGPPPSCCP